MTARLISSSFPPSAAGRVVPRVATARRAPAVATLLYCHDTYGLGHLRRTLAIARRLSASPSIGSQLVVTGSPVEHRFELPPDTDTVKLPAVEKLGDEAYAARSLGVGFPAVRAVRRELILGAVRAFRPDLVIVDHSPAGVGGEVLPALQHLRRSSPGTRIVLGLRDVIDDPARVRETWARDGIHTVLDELYDLIVVYGRQDVVDVVRDYNFSPRAAARTRFVGYLGREVVPRSRDAVLHETGLATERLAVVAAGGGGDGERLMATAIAAAASHRAPRDLGWVLVGGPLMPRAAFRRLTDAARGLRRVRVVEFLDNLPGTIGAADVVVAMAGYNAVCEILQSGRPAVLVPRVHPRLEQWIRAERLAERGLVRTLHPADATPRRLLRETLTAMDGRVPPLPAGLMDGMPRLERELRLLVAMPGEATAAGRL